MRLKQIAAVCKMEKQIVLYDVTDSEGVVSQWLGNSHAIYPIASMPHMNTDNVFSMFDIPAKEAAKWATRHYFSEEAEETGLNFGDYEKTDGSLREYEISLYCKGKMYKAFKNDAGEIIFINMDYLRPLAHVLDETMFLERKREGRGSYVVACTGLMISAIIMPTHPYKESAFVEEMEELTTLCRNAHRAGRDLSGA